MHPDIERLKSKAVRSWNNLSAGYRRSGRSYSGEEQLRRESEVDRLMAETDATARSGGVAPARVGCVFNSQPGQRPAHRRVGA